MYYVIMQDLFCSVPAMRLLFLHKAKQYINSANPAQLVSVSVEVQCKITQLVGEVTLYNNL